ncbi:MAG: DUF167 family protein [Devosia sp.]
MSVASSRPFRLMPDGLRLVLRVTPNAGADRIEAIETRDDGTCVLRVRVRAVPDRGRANAAVLSLLADRLGLPRTSLAIVSGETARIKHVAITGDPSVLAEKMMALIAPA